MLALGMILEQSAPAQTFKVLHTFTGPPDGGIPEGTLLLHADALYGTTLIGGELLPSALEGNGTVFELNIETGEETIVHAFAGPPLDTASPVAGLIGVAAGSLYGNTTGAVFQISPAGVETVLHTLSDTDGPGAEGVLVRDSQGNLFGTTTAGGAYYGYGTVFKLDPAGILTTIHSFSSYDGSYPQAGLLLKNGRLYGTTAESYPSYYGTVFEMSPRTGNLSTLYSFTGGPDGGYPHAPLIADEQGNLYGTTYEGGNSVDGVGQGVIFKLNIAAHEETVLHTFEGQSDGANPQAGLVQDSAGNFYGTTLNGGVSNAGTVFELDAAGTLTTLYNFTGGPDGAYPYAGLVLDSIGNLYGVASQGGVSGCSTPQFSSCGTVFEITP
jgi:uncharacterized repeat protein (TIGR03803 family)